MTACLLKAWVAVTPRCVSQGAELLGDPLGQENAMGLQLPRAMSQISAPQCACAAVPGSVLAASETQPQLPGGSAHQQQCLFFALRSAVGLPRLSITVPVSLGLQGGVPGICCS